MVLFGYSPVEKGLLEVLGVLGRRGGDRKGCGRAVGYRKGCDRKSLHKVLQERHLGGARRC